MHIYRTPWKKDITQSLVGYLRDLMIALYPFPRMPRFLRVFLIGADPDFIFLVHPRRKEDVFIAWPFIGPLRILLRKRFYGFIQWMPPTILDVIRTTSGLTGVVVSSTWLPQALIERRKHALREARRCIRFSAKLSRKNAYVGLGEWWPFLTKRGEAIQKYAFQRGLQATSGYCGTLCSLILAVKQISEISAVPLSNLTVSVLGVGKMGSSVVKALREEGVEKLVIFDKNTVKQKRLLQEMNGRGDSSVRALSNKGTLADIFEASDLCVCTTSNLRRLLRPDDIPPNTLILDDSRPEAIPRICDRKRGIFVMEGGLMRIRGLRQSYDFGFGSHEEVFGCLAEAYLLACDKGKTLRPTIGDIDLDNYRQMMSSMDSYSVEPAAFRSSHAVIEPAALEKVVRIRHGGDTPRIVPLVQGGSLAGNE